MVAKPPGRLHPSRLEIDPSKKWPGRNVTVMPAAAPIALSIQIAVHTSPTVEARVGFVRSDAGASKAYRRSQPRRRATKRIMRLGAACSQSKATGAMLFGDTLERTPDCAAHRCCRMNPVITLLENSNDIAPM